MGNNVNFESIKAFSPSRENDQNRSIRGFEELGLNEENTIRLLRSLEQADRGEFIDHESIKAKYAKWLTLPTAPDC